MSDADGLIIGYDLCPDFVRISCYCPGKAQPEDFSFDEEGLKQSIATLLCKKRGAEEWMIGEEALENALTGSGIMVDNLLGMMQRRGETVLEGVRYTADMLLDIFLRKTIQMVQDKYHQFKLSKLYFTIPKMEPAWMETIYQGAAGLGLESHQVRILCHADSFGCYIGNQSGGRLSGITALFDLTKVGLDYYEIRCNRSARPQQLLVQHEALEERFSLDILKQKAGIRMADSILTSCAERLFHGKAVTQVFLAGEGLAHCREWSEKFLETICKQRKVYYHHNLFAQGALAAAIASMDSQTSPYLLLCEGRIPSDISIEVVQQNTKKKLILCQGGSDWYEAGATVELMPDTCHDLQLQIRRLTDGRVRTCSISLEALPKRPERTTRLEVSIFFPSAEEMTVRIKDLGFGELYPATDTVIEEKIYIG